MKSNWLNEINYLRGFSILPIIASHILYYDMEDEFYILMGTIFLNSTLLYGFISGYLFQHLIDGYTFKSYLKKKMSYVVLPYIVTSIPILVLRLKTGPSYLASLNFPDISNHSILAQIGYYISTGSHLIPFWFIPMIFLFYLLAPLLKIIDERPFLYWCLIPLLVLAQFFPRNEIQDLSNPFYMLANFAFIYVFGMFISYYSGRLDKLVRKNVYSLLVLFSAFTLGSILSATFQHQFIYFQKITLVILLLHGLKRIRSIYFIRVLDALAQTSFGIYFLHFYVILIIRMVSLKLLGSEYPQNPLIWVLNFIIILTITYFSVYMIKRIIGKRSRLLVGS